MKRFTGKKRLAAILLVSALVLSLFGMIAVNAMEKASADKADTNTAPTAYAGSLLNEKLYSVTHNRSRWLYDLMTVTDITDVADSTAEKVQEAAAAQGIIDSGDIDALYQPLDRRYVAETLVKALHYPLHNAGYLADVDKSEKAISTAVYYGYFLPDINYMVFPDARITSAEYDALLTELSRYRLLKGKTILSFGDSIMYGAGNQGEGISDMIAAKYGMECIDYSVSGSTMGTDGDRPHIPDQLRQAFSDGKTADVILLNGGTNDVKYTELGGVTDGFDKMKSGETTFTEGFEKALWILRECWKDTPVIYIRAHNMQFDDNDRREDYFGERSMLIAEKWEVVSVDLYHQSGMNAEDPLVCNRYTAFSPTDTRACDSVHPTAVGYAKFYLPPITEAMVGCISEKE